MSYSLYQKTAMALIPKVSGTMGFLSSSFIISEVVRDHNQGLGNPIKRAIGAVAIYDMADSFGWWLSTWAVPNDFPFASGTVATCNFQGFLLQFVIGAPLSNVLLSFLFYNVVLDRSSTTIAITERVIHCLIAMIAFGTALGFLAMDQFNPISVVCLHSGYPLGCGNSIFGGGDVPCLRGDYAYLYSSTFYLVIWAAIILQSFFNWRIRQLLLKSDSNDAKWVTKQALLYSVAFLITWTPSTIWSVYSYFNPYGSFILDISSTIFEPLQGFWNLLIFLQNRPDSWQRLEYILLWDCCFPVDDDDKENVNGKKDNKNTTLAKD